MSTKIEWTNESWNPVTGCTKVSQGCKHCYAERLWPKVDGARVAREGGQPREFTDVRCHPERLDQPLRWVKPRRIFVNSMSDLFHEDVPDDFIDQIFAVMALCPQHSFQALTKRPARMLTYMTTKYRAHSIGCGEFAIANADPTRRIGGAYAGPVHRRLPLENVWLGVSVEDQATADERIPPLLQTTAAVRFISYEPALGPVNVGMYLTRDHLFSMMPGFTDPLPGLNWIIAGGESGPHARPAHPDWFRLVRDQCAVAGVAFFFKQWGEWVSLSEVEGAGPHHYFDDGAGVRRVGKKKAGRRLDGREHSEYPA